MYTYPICAQNSTSPFKKEPSNIELCHAVLSISDGSWIFQSLNYVLINHLVHLQDLSLTSCPLPLTFMIERYVYEEVSMARQPLSEISVNSSGRNGDTTMFSDGPTESIVKSYIDRESQIDSAPPSVQSMLKNSTEIGDVGQFSSKPSRIPYPTSISNNRTTRLHRGLDGLPIYPSRKQPVRERARNRHRNTIRKDSLRSSRGTTASSLISMYQDESQESIRPHASLDQNDNQRTFSMPQSSHVAENVRTHSSSGQLRPRSPFAYPTRLKRPGYRPSSPALADFNGTDTRTKAGFESTAVTRSFSPLSQHTRAHMAFNIPDIMTGSPSLQNPHSAARSRNRGARTPTTLLRTPGPRPPSSQSTKTLGRGIGRNVSHDSSSAVAHSFSPSPIYYDYSEAFEDEYQFRTSTVFIPSLLDKQETDGKAQVTVHELDGEAKGFGDVLAPSDPPTMQIGHVVHDVESPNPVLAASRFVAQMSEWEKEESARSTNVGDTGKVAFLGDFQQTESLAEHPSVNEEDPPIGNTIGHHVLSSSRRRRYGEHFLSHLRRPSRTLESKSVLSLKTNAPILPTIPVEVKVAATESLGMNRSKEVTSDTTALWKSSDFDRTHHHGAKPTSFVTNLTEAGRAENINSLASKDIQAQVPHRSMSRKDPQERFSRIFSMDHIIIDPELARAGAKVHGETHQSEICPRIRCIGHDNSQPSISFVSSAVSSNYSKNTAVNSEANGKSSVPDVTDYPNEFQHEQEDGKTSSLLTRLKHSTSRDGVACLDNTTIPWTINNAPTVPQKQKEFGQDYHGINKPVLRAPNAILPPHDCLSLKGLKQMPQCAIPLRSSSKPGTGRLVLAAPKPTVQSPTEYRPMPLLEAATVVPWEFEDRPSHNDFPIATHELRTRSEKRSTSSLPESKLTNLDASFSWAHQSDHIDVVRPVHSEPDTLHSTETPKFNLKVTRASNSTGGTVKVTKREK